MKSGFYLAQGAHQDGLQGVIHEELDLGGSCFLVPVIDSGEAERIELEFQQGICLVEDGGDAFNYEFHNELRVES